MPQSTSSSSIDGWLKTSHSPFINPMKVQITKAPFRVGGQRNAHGTRLSHRVECPKCGREDYISSRPKAGKMLLCKTCAAADLQVLDVGMRAKPVRVKTACPQCHCVYEADPRWLEREGVLCRNCHQGFEIWQGSLDKPKNVRVIVEKRASHVLLRRKKPLV